MTAELRRLHVTVSRRFLAKLDAARDALSHARPGASTEDVLEAALDLLLAQDARRRAAAAKNPRAAAKADLPVGADGDEPGPSTDGRRVAEAPATRAARHVPAAVRREVWARDEARCQWPLSSGGVCGSTHRLELDHVHPVALGGPSTAANVRILCERHNKLAARRVFGDAWIDRCARSREPALPLLSGES